ncbi:6-bladed beta-propeller [candidate division KSB1 bacterium]
MRLKLITIILSICLLSVILYFIRFGLQDNNRKIAAESQVIKFNEVNNTESQWGDDPKIGLSLFKTIGGEDEMNLDYNFYRVQDLTADNSGHFYVLSRGDKCIRKYNKDGEFIRQFGRPGEGPGEFQEPVYLDLDNEGNMYIEDLRLEKMIIMDQSGNEIRRFSLENLPYNDPGMPIPQNSSYAGAYQEVMRLSSGRFVKLSTYPFPPPMNTRPPELEKLCRIYEEDGKLYKEFGEARQYNDWLMNYWLSYKCSIARDEEDNIYITFWNQNRIEKYDPEGNLILRISRPLPFEETTEKDVVIRLTLYAGEQVETEALRYNTVSRGIDVDDKGRMWVVTSRDVSRRGEDFLHKFDIFGKNGVFLGSIDLDTFIGRYQQYFAIQGNRLFVLNKTELSVEIYDIINK